MIQKLFNRVKKRAALELRLEFLLWLKRREFKHDPCFDLDLVEAGFKDRLNAPADDSALLRRIVKAYKLAKTAQQEAAAKYQVSNEWLPIYERPLLEVMTALREENLEALQRIYGNFMRDDCSSGLQGLPIDMTKHFFGGHISRRNRKRFLTDFVHRLRMWQNLMGATHPVEALASPRIGNPYGLEVAGQFIKSGADYLHYYATLIGRLVGRQGRRTVVELGGGYGGMAYYLVRDHDNITYFDFDLPENLALTSYYLLKSFPEKNIQLYGEYEEESSALATADAILLPNFAIDNMPDACADLIFNSYSLAEMAPETIATYIGKFMQMGREYILHINHNKNSVVVADDFGLDPERFSLLYKIPALWNGGRSLDMDEYEYLYKKVGTSA